MEATAANAEGQFTAIGVEFASRGRKADVRPMHGAATEKAGPVPVEEIHHQRLSPRPRPAGPRRKIRNERWRHGDRFAPEGSFTSGFCVGGAIKYSQAPATVKPTQSAWSEPARKWMVPGCPDSVPTGLIEKGATPRITRRKPRWSTPQDRANDRLRPRRRSAKTDAKNIRQKGGPKPTPTRTAGGRVKAKQLAQKNCIRQRTGDRMPPQASSTPTTPPATSSRALLQRCHSIVKSGPAEAATVRPHLHERLDLVRHGTAVKISATGKISNPLPAASCSNSQNDDDDGHKEPVEQRPVRIWLKENPERENKPATQAGRPETDADSRTWRWPR